MRIAAIAATILILGVANVSASEWMGSLSFTKTPVPGATTATWNASLKNGSGTLKVKGTNIRYNVQKSNSFFIVSDKKGGGIVGTGMVHKGHVSGVFQVGAIAGGSFDGDRASKGGKSKK